jgi:hypothetical protein
MSVNRKSISRDVDDLSDTERLDLVTGCFLAFVRESTGLSDDDSAGLMSELMASAFIAREEWLAKQVQ